MQVTSYTRKSRKYSSYKGKAGTVAPNRIRRRFNTHIPHQKITTDTTEFKYYEVDEKGHMTIHKLYPDPFMDMCNGEILSYEIYKNPSAKNVMDALNDAIETTADCPFKRTFHSDQGWAYQMKAYSHRLKEERIFQSMSRKGNCLDNSVMENFLEYSNKRGTSSLEYSFCIIGTIHLFFIFFYCIIFDSFSYIICLLFITHYK